MKIVTIIENNAITGVRYGIVEIFEYNNNIQRRLDRYYNTRNKKRYLAIRAQNTKHK